MVPNYLATCRVLYSQRGDSTVCSDIGVCDMLPTMISETDSGNFGDHYLLAIRITIYTLYIFLQGMHAWANIQGSNTMYSKAHKTVQIVDDIIACAI